MRVDRRGQGARSSPAILFILGLMAKGKGAHEGSLFRIVAHAYAIHSCCGWGSSPSDTDTLWLFEIF
jgi:hypothetical protein